MVLQFRIRPARMGVDMGLGELIAEAGGAEAAEGPDLAAPEAPAEAPAKSEELGVQEDAGGRPVVPVGALTTERARRRAAEESAAKYQAELKTAGEAKSAFDKLYGQFDKPLDQMREDAEFAQAVWQLRDDPIVKQALAKIQQHHQGATKAVSERDEKPAQPAGDPRVDDLVREGVRDKARGILGEAKVRDQLHGPILDYVLAQNVKPTREAILTAMREYVGAQGWTNEFLRGSGQKPKPAMVPNPGGLNAGAPKKGAPEAPPKPKSLSEVEAQRRSKFKELIQQKLG